MIEAYVTNLGKYTEGELVGKWVKFPTNSETIANTLENIGIGAEYEEFFITDYDLADTPDLYSHLGEYPSLEELNYLALMLENLDENDLQKYNACLESGVVSIGSLADAINLAQNMDSYVLNSDIEDKYDLGYYYVHDTGIYDTKDMGTLANYIDYEAFGRDISYEQIGAFCAGGYLEEIDRITEYYRGIDDIPKEDRLFSSGENKENESLKNTELSTEQNDNMIDGVRNNMAPDKDESITPPSLLGVLKEKKKTVRDTPTKTEKEIRSPSKDDPCR